MLYLSGFFQHSKGHQCYGYTKPNMEKPKIKTTFNVKASWNIIGWFKQLIFNNVGGV